MNGYAIENREVSWTLFGIPLRGTITAPAGREAGPAVIFVAGSGPTDRNWCSPLLPGTNGSAKLLAEMLASKGFITLRYDKLAANPEIVRHQEDLTGRISMQSHIDELAGAVTTLTLEFAVSSLFALGNSEGCIHAVNYQLQKTGVPFAGLVLTGAPGRTVGEVARGQLAAQLASLPGSGAHVMAYYDRVIADFTAGKPMQTDPAYPKEINQFLRTLENPLNLPFSRELWTYSLPEHLAGVDVPVLVLIGKKDIQIDWIADGKPLEAALSGKPDAALVWPEQANHVLKHESRKREDLDAASVYSRYNAADAGLDTEASDAILGWLTKHSRDS
ncbi:MAG TPA: alpha/beta hydrolase [Methanoregula sp.]|nr:alpha/beta hydrolase [Methanoregula sp.]